LRPDLIFFDHAGLARIMTLPVPGLLGRPYVVFVHGSELSSAGKGQRASALLGADRILVNSEFTRERVRKTCGAACPPIHVVTLCIDPARISRWEADPRPPPTAREPAVLIVGRILAQERGKGHDQLLEAWPKVLATVPRAQLWIVGDGNDVDRLRRKAAQLDLGDRVSIPGRISDDELRDRYLRASLFAMPSCQEGFGIVYAEAMWHGLPCLGSHADAARTVIEDGETGLLVPYGDVEAIASAISGLLSDPARTRKMGEAGTRVARSKFNFERFRTDLLEALLAPAAE
jgi:phosphatidylinositol alpha-1,6-mannosyltransferase